MVKVNHNLQNANINGRQMSKTLNIGYTTHQWKYAVETARGAQSCSCVSAAKTLLRAPRPSKSCISIDKQYNLFRRRPTHSRRGPRRVPGAGEAKKVFVLVSFCIVETSFYRRCIGYSKLEVVAASSQRQAEFLCTEACHTPIEGRGS